MPRTPAQTFDWKAIQLRYEKGESAYAIAKHPSMPKKQSIMYRAKAGGWVSPKNGTVLSKAEATKATEGVLERILGLLKNGSTFELACQTEDISARHVRRLREDNPDMEEAIAQARAEKTTRRIRKIEEAGDRDAKALQWLVERDPDSREIYRPRDSNKGEGGIQIVLHIDRTKREIEAIDVTPDKPRLPDDDEINGIATG